jgi:flavin reductase (DIM6/NTAB) family NADH-FMN oxidoreductase RutF
LTATQTLGAASPIPPDPAEYRKALSCFATGVTVVTSHWQGSDWGMTCNSFSSVSLEPRLVLWSMRKAVSIVFANWGARLSQRIDKRKLQLAFAGFLALVAAHILLF